MIIQWQKWKLKKNVWNLIKINDNETRTTSSASKCQSGQCKTSEGISSAQIAAGKWNLFTIAYQRKFVVR